MTSRALALFLPGNQAYEVVQHDRSERVERVVTFPKAGEGTDQSHILESGWQLGEEATDTPGIRDGAGVRCRPGLRAAG